MTEQDDTSDRILSHARAFVKVHLGGQPMWGFNKRRRMAKLVAAILVLAICIATLQQSIDLTQFQLVNLPNSDHDPATTATTHHEPYLNLWQRRFSSSSGHLFFKHMRKAGGIAVRNYLHAALDHHGHATFEQFLNDTDREEARRHLPFLTNKQKKQAEEHYNHLNNTTTDDGAITQPFRRVHFVEQEFSAMDWECRDVDPKWNNSLSVVVLRHPIERLLSEFFYSGPPAVGGTFQGKQFGKPSSNRLHIDRKKLYTNKTYTRELSEFLRKYVPPWAKSHAPVWTEIPGKKSHRWSWSLSSQYTDNFQVRALAGCASGECLDERKISSQYLDTIHKGHPATSSATQTIDSVCTMHPFYVGKGKCNSQPKVCPTHCDGPCFYPAAAWGPLNEKDLSRAKHSLEGFDIIMLTEKFDAKDQVALLSDAMGVPLDVLTSYTSAQIKKSAGNVHNIYAKKENSREKTHYYRDLLSNLTQSHLLNPLFEENRMEIELYQHAVKLNKMMTDRWKSEAKWRD